MPQSLRLGTQMINLQHKYEREKKERKKKKKQNKERGRIGQPNEPKLVGNSAQSSN